MVKGNETESAPWSIEPMTESCLADVMDIEFDSFPDPWAPLAYLAELRHNRRATYLVARDASERVQGYIGWWIMADSVAITRIAVSPHARRSGLGRALVQQARAAAASDGKERIQLLVRESNGHARAFYHALGFSEVGGSAGYYKDPDEDGIIMALPVT